MNRWLPWLVGLAPLYLVRFSFSGVPTTLYELILVLSMLVAVGTGAVDYVRLWRRLGSVWRWAIGLMLIGGIVGVVLSPDRRAALGELKAFVVEPVLLALLILGTLDADDLPRVLLGYLMSATVVSLISLAGWATHAGWAIAGDGRLLGLFGLEANASPNYLAFWVAPAVALGIAWIGTSWQKNQEPSAKNQIRAKDQGPRTTTSFGSWKFGSYLDLGIWNLELWLIAVATVVCFAAVIATESRAGIASAIVAGVLALVAYYRSTLVEFRFAQGVGWLLMIGLVLFGVAVIQPDFSQSAVSGGRISTSNNIRWEIWRTTGELLTQSPANFIGGLGLASYQDRFAELTNGRVNYPEFITPRALTPHNLWLNAWVNLGLLGLVGMTLLIVIAKVSLWKAEPTHKAALVTAVLACILLQGLVDTPNWKNDTAALFLAALASATLLARPMEKRK